MLVFLNLSLGLSLAIQALFHPTLETNARMIYLIVAIILANAAIFSSIAYSAAMAQSTFTIFNRGFRDIPKPEADRRWRSLLNVATYSTLIATLLALAALNLLFFLERTETGIMVWVISAATALPLIVTFGYYQAMNRGDGV